MMEESKWFEWAGISFGCEETYKIFKSLTVIVWFVNEFSYYRFRSRLRMCDYGVRYLVKRKIIMLLKVRLTVP